MERKLLKNFDWILLGLMIVLAAIGLIAVATATGFRSDSPSTWNYFIKQVSWLAVGLTVLLVVLTVNYHVLFRWWHVLYVVNLGLLLAVRFFGREALGAQRWLQLGPVDIQPSELAKLIVIITLATQLARREGKARSWSDLGLALVHIAPPMLLVLLQPDLGTSMVFLAIMAGILYVAGFSGAKLVGLALAGLVAAVAYVAAHLKWGVPLPLESYQLKRLTVFLNPESEPLDAGYHIIQSKIAIGSGKITGQGLFNGQQNQLNYLPEQHTDFIFSVIGEEMGFVGGVIVLGLFLLILRRGLRVIAQARDIHGSLLGAGVVSMLAFHVLVNVGMTMGMLPVTGVPLPFVSYGGSSLLTNSIAIGLLLNIHMRRKKILF